MRIYTVHRGIEPKPRGDDLAFVKEGFSWPVLLLPLFWPLYHGMWGVFAVVLAVIVGAEALIDAGALPAGPVAAAEVMLLVGYAFEANNLRRWMLARRGWRQVALVSGGSLAAAERRLFDLYALTPTGMLVARTELAL